MESLPLITADGNRNPEEVTNEVYSDLKGVRVRRCFFWRSFTSSSREPDLRKSGSLFYLRKAAVAVTPSFVHGFFSLETSTSVTAADRFHETTYLDGIRGLASLVVYVSHVAGYVYKGMLYGYGITLPPDDRYADAKSLDNNRYILQLPIVRCFVNASMMVSLFFVISGFALSIRPIQRMRVGEEDKLLQSLSSSAFRRPIRLYLPAFFSTILPFIMIRLGLYETPSQILQENQIPNPFGQSLGPLPTLWTEFRGLVENAVRMVYVCAPIRSGYLFNGPVWTIPQEFAASLFLYLTQLTLGRLQPRVRMFAVCLLIFIALSSDTWNMSLFFGGFLIAEWNNLIRAKETSDGRKRFNNVPWKAFFGVNFVMASYLGSYPAKYGDDTPGYRWLSMAIPSNWTMKNRFWESIGAIQMIMAISRLQPIKDWLSRPTIRYLGHISFGLYLVHTPLVAVIGVRLLALLYTMFDPTNDATCFLGFVLGLLITSVPVFWAADLFTRYVDIPCTNFGKKLEGLLLMVA